MSHQIAAAIILNGIFQRIEAEKLSLDEKAGLLYDVPKWFKALHPMKPFPKEKPNLPDIDIEIVKSWEKDPCYDLPDHLMWYQEEVNAYKYEEGAWNHAEALKLLRKWVIWCADFCDIKQGFSLTLNGLLDE